MNLNWLNKKNNDKLIIFFNGWGMDDGVVSHLICDDYDVLTVCDYNSLEPLPDFAEYKSINVVAWSMGVMIAGVFAVPCDSATAINGTPYSINAEFGINPKVYKLMELGFNDDTKDKFVAKMFDEIPVNFIAPSRSTENRKSELSALRNYTPNPNFKFNRVLVSDNDKIIPTVSQMNYWKSAENVAGGHCIFYNYTHWKELL